MENKDLYTHEEIREIVKILGEYKETYVKCKQRYYFFPQTTTREEVRAIEDKFKRSIETCLEKIPEDFLKDVNFKPKIEDRDSELK